MSKLREILVEVSNFYVFFLKCVDIIVVVFIIIESWEKVVDFSVFYMFYMEDMLLKKIFVKESIDLL